MKVNETKREEDCDRIPSPSSSCGVSFNIIDGVTAVLVVLHFSLLALLWSIE